MEASERICIIAKAAEPGIREQSYMNQLAGSCGENLRSRVVRAVNLIPEGSKAIDLRAPLEGDFGKDISKLTERLINVIE